MTDDAVTDAIADWDEDHDGHEDRPPPPPIPGQLLDLIEEMIDDLEGARGSALSPTVKVDRNTFLAKLRELQAALPEELRAARWMVRQRATYVARTNERAREVLERAKELSQTMVAESTIVQEAVEEANRLVRNAEREAERIRLEAEDDAERRLAELEAVLLEITDYVQQARSQLHESLPPPPDVPLSG
jgi:polyhydroxyalkanoate synthesis regulator phasin